MANKETTSYDARILYTEEDRNVFFAVLMNAPCPNQSLKSALDKHRKLFHQERGGTEKRA